MTLPDPSRLLRDPTPGSEIRAASEPSRAGRLLKEGDRLGRRYLLEHRIGTGGMSVVWRAWDEALQRPVAVKVMDSPLSAGFGDRELIRREARAAARIDHPHAMGVFDVGETITAGGRITTYVVMRLLDGRSLADTLAAGPLPWPRAVAIAGRVAEVLNSAHAHGVVHRDVTPENVMLTAEGAKLLDFGIAAQVGERDGEGPNPVFGTPPYVAPERLHGAAADGSTDVYALGVLLYEMITGHLPYPETTWEELEVANRGGDPPALTDVPGLPGRVSRICQRCLALEPAARPTAREVREELAAALRAQGSPLRTRLRRVALVATAAVAAASLVTLTIALTAPQLLHRQHGPAAKTQTSAGLSHAPSPHGSQPVIAEPLLGPLSTGSPASPTPSSPVTSRSPVPAPRQLTVTEAQAAINGPLAAAVAAGTVRLDVKVDISQQVGNLVDGRLRMSTGERNRQLDVIKAGVRTRAQSHDLPDGLAADLEVSLVTLGQAMDREAGGPAAG